MRRTFRLFVAILCASVSVSLVSMPAFAQNAAPPAALGIAVGDSDGKPVVAHVLPNLTAAKMGVLEGDLIIEAGGKPITSAEQVIAYAHELTVGGDVSIVVQRGDGVFKLTGLATARPDDMPSGPPPGSKQ